MAIYPPVDPWSYEGVKPPPPSRPPRPRPPSPAPPSGEQSAAPESATGGGGGGSDTYNPLEDPFYRQLKALYDAQTEQERAAALSRIASLKAYYGEPESSDPLSLFGRLLEQYGLAQKVIPASLAARGLFRSGSTAYRLNQARIDYLRRRYDLSRQLAETIAGIEAGLAAGIFQRQAALIQAAWNAAIMHALTGGPGGGPGGGGPGGGGPGGGGPGGGETPYTYTVPSGGIIVPRGTTAIAF